MKNRKTILKIRNLTKFFVSHWGINQAVNNFSLDLKEKEIVGLIGQSGSGKTTVARALLRIINEVNGIVEYDKTIISGKRITKQARKKLRRDIQMVFQDASSALNERRNIFSTLSEPLKVHKIIQKDQKEMFYNWNDVTKIFKYDFTYKFNQAYFKYLSFRNQRTLVTYKKIIQNLKTFDTKGEKKHFKDTIDELYSIYYADSLAENKKLINMLFNLEESLFVYYQKAKTKLEKLNIDQDEVELIKAKNNLKQYLQNVKFNNQIDKNQQKLWKKRKQDLNILKEETKNSLKSLENNFKNIEIFYKHVAQISTDLNHFKIWNRNKQKYTILNKEIKKIIANKDIVFLQTEQIFSLSDDITKYVFDIFEKNFEKFKNNEKDFLNLFSFDNQKYITFSKSNLSNFEKETNKEINQIKEIKKYPSIQNKNKVIQLKKIIEDKEKINKKEKNTFLKTWEPKNQALLKNIDKEDKLWKSQEFKEKRKEAKRLFKQKIIEIQKLWNSSHKKHLNKFLAEITTRFQSKNASFEYEENKMLRNLIRAQIILGLKKQLPFVKKASIFRFLMQRKIFKALEDVDLKIEHAYRYPHEFSGGQKQRILIAKTLISNPKVIIADEPVASLDVSIQAQVINILVDLIKTKKISMIFIGHDLSTIEYLADQILVMHNGKVVERGKTEEIFQNTIHPYTKTLFKAMPKIANANEPFKIYSNNNEYLKGYNDPTTKMQEITPNHFVLASNSQFTSWKKSNEKQKTQKKQKKSKPKKKN